MAKWSLLGSVSSLIHHYRLRSVQEEQRKKIRWLGKQFFDDSYNYVKENGADFRHEDPYHNNVIREAFIISLLIQEQQKVRKNKYL